ncbi:hypothetical protein [Actinoplanes lobatus]|uniref:Uncharacterized protein n=1 Tax=Actinoplanes lobatus TaxID=113568 RepID=A0A7W7HLW7_9ACTN|nr:hypothetical protein [Actinoplanes lobatus]MBB4752938.1 hypothetical protein [Actinoplanes lobatus]
MSEAFNSHARLYDLMFPGSGPAIDFYRADANRHGGHVPELGCSARQYRRVDGVDQPLTEDDVGRGVVHLYGDHSTPPARSPGQRLHWPNPAWKNQVKAAQC